MSELAISALTFGTIAALVVGFFYAPAWQAGAILGLLAIYFRMDKDNENTNKNITALASNIQGMYEQWKKAK